MNEKSSCCTFDCTNGWPGDIHLDKKRLFIILPGNNCSLFSSYLNLYTVSHSHTGAMIAKKLAESMATWQIDQRKLLYLITDNGSNMVKWKQHGEGCQITKGRTQFG